MANILLTEGCVRSCPYCFAKKHLADSNPDDILSWADFLYLVDLLQSSGENHVSLLGGEPTLHPDFVAIARYTSGSPISCQRGHRRRAVAGNVGARATVLVDVAPDALSFVCNLTRST